MANYEELIQQRDALNNQIEEARKREAADAIAQARNLVKNFGLTVKDVFPTGRAARGQGKGKGIKVAAKYRDPATGSTWSGRGKPPKWIEGKDRSKFLI